MKPEMEAALLEKRFDMGKRLKVRSKKVEMKNKKLKTIFRVKESAVQHIRSICQTTINKIKQKETQLLDEQNTITQTYAGQLRSGLKLEEIEMHMYRQHCEFIDQALVSDCVMNLYDAYQALESGAIELGDVRDTDTVDTRRIDDVRFTSNAEHVQHIIDNLHLGKIHVTYQDQTKCLLSPVLVGIKDGRMAGDEKEADLRDVTVLVVDGTQTAVVTDMKNECVKSFYTTNNQRCQSKLPLGDLPCGVTQLKEKQVMVAVPGSHQIVTVKVTPDLALLSSFTTNKVYYSLAVLNPSCLAAGGYGVVDILDMAGHVLRTLTKRNKTLFTFPYYMCVNSKGNILVSDERKKSVTCLTSEGDVVFKYAPTGDRALSLPRGITTTSKGDILLVDRSTNEMIQLTESGELVGDVLKSKDVCDVFCDKYGFFFLCTKTDVREYMLV
ncbi:uncharacterized protein LOC125378010 [Haliotis rufescens]|uniref:uncharacterized protein LOC125378010 n=1 Tax=Haliotis rufescens TaxID=6454 RepID=UPI00201F6574|nr:uncharacterized protein LOC125378010 [Haliotis rufescens]